MSSAGPSIGNGAIPFAPPPPPLTGFAWISELLNNSKMFSGINFVKNAAPIVDSAYVLYFLNQPFREDCQRFELLIKIVLPKKSPIQPN